ncbi:MAG: DUF5012 domain-containing protein [Niabella sp.]|nr:DUF5012 domain-containing protein [Niabella sp.]
MNKKTLNILMLLAVCVITVTSCKKDSKGVSFMTTYADIILKRTSTIDWQLGTPFVDPGFTANEGETDLTQSVTVKSNVDVSKPGVYSVSYTVSNSDGYPSTVTRTVVVCETSAPLNGFYQSSIIRNGSAKRGPFSQLVYGIGNNRYHVQDLLGGWYDIGSGYGPLYAGAAIVELKNNNTFELISSEALGFSDGSAPIFTTPATYTPQTKTIAFTSMMADTPAYLFAVTMVNSGSINR